MKISEIIPYERNVRHNERAIPAVAASIKEFGLREYPNRNKTVETHELKSGFYTKTWSGRLQTHNVDLSKATVVRGQTFAIKELLKSEGFRWDSASKEWRKNA